MPLPEYFLRVNGQSQELGPPFESVVLRKEIEPWLSAVEHFSLLIGSGLPIAVAAEAGGSATVMEPPAFSAAHAEKVSKRAETMAANAQRLTTGAIVRKDRGLFEIDFFPVGEAGHHGDAVSIRFTRADTGDYGYVIIDAGFQQNGQDFVNYVKKWYETSAVNLAIVTHPDGDHIGGMGDVIRELDVEELWIHRLGDRGGRDLRAAEAVDELIALAEERGTTVVEPFAGTEAFSGALKILGPDEAWYAQMVQEQLAEAEERAAPKAASRLLEAARVGAQKLVAALPMEIPFDDAGGTNPRNNSSAITLLEADQRRLLFTSDAGVPPLERALDWIESEGGDATSPWFVQMPHHGSRHNASSAFLDRLLGPKTQSERGSAFVNVAPEAVKHPSPRVANAFGRRGYPVYQTRGQAIRHGNDAPQRDGWGPVDPIGPLDESEED